MRLYDLIKKRRAYRSLEPVNITDEMIQALGDSAQLAASCFNNQPWRYVFVYDKGMLENLFATLSKGNEWAKDSSLIIAVFSTVSLDCQVRGRDYYLFDTGMATAFLILRATELDLVAHPIAGFDEKAAKEVLHIPEEMTVITLLCCGRHAETLSPVLSEKQRAWEGERPQRLAVDGFIYRNMYGKD